jgi:hypothetical protein
MLVQQLKQERPRAMNKAVELNVEEAMAEQLDYSWQFTPCCLLGLCGPLARADAQKDWRGEDRVKKTSM